MKRSASLAALALAFFGFFQPRLFSQKEATIIDFGLAGRLEIGKKNNTAFTLSACLGFGRHVLWRELFENGNDHAGFSAAFKVGLNLYRGGIGNSKLPGYFDDHQIDLFNSFSITPGMLAPNSKIGEYAWRRPLYSWNANYADALDNPWKYSLTAATNFIWNIPINGRQNGSKKAELAFSASENGRKQRGDRDRRSQRIGFFGLALQQLSAGYYNDGPPFSRWLGDGFDRYWTGGGFVHLSAQRQRFDGTHDTGQEFIASFDKFTGYHPDAYEVANVLKLGKVPYKNYGTGSFNRGVTRFTYLRGDFGMQVSRVDSRAGRDIQDRIHRLFGYPYHPNLYKSAMTVSAFYSTRAALPGR